jgi:glyoxylase-like metal-dependent hydrolase (beta-lactamase superfamily II)
MMENYICKTCGVQYAATDAPPRRCPICADDRQYIGWEGQQWTTMDELGQNHHNLVKVEEPNLTGIGTEPGFAIGQRALLVQTPRGNVLWDSISLLDQPTVDAINVLGGIDAFVCSHPHMHAAMIEWSKAFPAPVYLHADDSQWVMRPDPAIEFWEGETKQLDQGVTLIRCGGHFPGSTVLHWPAGADGKGVLLAGDTITVVQDRRYVSFMYSYPNLIPLNATAVRGIVDAVESLEFDRIYSAWWDKVVRSDAKTAVKKSAERYIMAIGG